MRWSEIRHQERAIALLRRSLRSGRMHHAYLFHGPAGVGKRTAAEALAARLLCEADGLEPDAEACGACEACRLMGAGTHPDYHLVHRGLHKFHPERSVRQSKGLFLVVDLVRHFVIEPSTTSPRLGRRRVFVLREAERMNEEAQNALLKTLEEPPGQAVIVLLTRSAGRLLPTILSRCQQVAFGALPADFVGEKLAEAGVEADEARALARLTEGRLGEALRWHRAGVYAALGEVAGLVGALRGRGAIEAFGKGMVEAAGALAGRLFADEPDEAGDESERPTRGRSAARTVPPDQLREALRVLLGGVAALQRESLLEYCGGGALRCLPEKLARASGLDGDPERAEGRILAVSEAETMLARNVNAQLACERLAVRLRG